MIDPNHRAELGKFVRLRRERLTPRRPRERRRTELAAGSMLFVGTVAAAMAHAQTLPSAQNREFAYLMTFFSGQWDCSGHFSNGTSISSTESSSSMMSGAWMQQVHDDRPPFSYHAYSYWGIDKPSQDLIVTILDVTGGIRLFRSSDWHESSFSMDSQPVIGHGDTNERFSYEKKSPGVFTFAYSIRKGAGEWVIGDQLECKRSP
jgi:hypothetical protein